MKGKYSFARLFVRAAKGIAVALVFIGTGFCVLRYYQASIAADAAAYQLAPDLQQALDKLKDEFLSTEQIVESFNTANQSTTPPVEGPRFPVVIESSEDLVAISTELSRLDQQRQRLKESIVSRFENLVKGIEEKLHAYAAALQPSSSPATSSPNQDVAALDSPEPPAAGPDQSLFSSKLDSSSAVERNQSLNERKEFLQSLAIKAENAENRVILGEAADQLDRLSKLLSQKTSVAGAARLESNSSDQPQAENKLLPSESVARQLEQLRGSVRHVLFDSWTLDDAFERAASLVAAEREKERAATIAQQGIWLSAVPRIGIGLVATALASLLILVFADLVQTQLDTASSSVTVAEAINSLSGSFTRVSETEPNREPTIKTEYAMPVVEEGTPIEGGS